MTLKLNTILHTKDGRQIGNAIITGIKNEYFEVTTDYGNKVIFTINEITHHFYIGKIAKKDHKHFVKKVQLTINN